MDSIQIWVMIITLAVFVAMAFFMNRSIKKYEKNKAMLKKKKGRLKYMPEVKNNRYK